MKSMQGLLHRTSLQEAQERRQAPPLAPTAVAGVKRSWSSNDGASRPSTVQFQRTISLPAASRRLSASAIVRLRDADAVSEYSQRRRLAATPSSSRDAELDLAHPTYGLLPRLVANLASLGVKHMYPWQKNCLKGPGLLDGDKSLVYCAPTGGGKSLVADLLMLKRVIEEPGAKALLVLPYVALVQEKVRWLRRVVHGLEPLAGLPGDDGRRGPWRRRADQSVIRVAGFFGGGKIRPTWDDFEIGVCTLEKVNALINTAIDDCSIPRLRAVVLDELHMVDDDHRGYLLELIATKLLCLDQSIQIVGMSATLPNMNLMAEWLEAHCYETRYRPVPIEEHLVFDGKVFPAASDDEPPGTPANPSSQDFAAGRVTPVRRIQSSAHKELADPVLNAVVSLAHETASMGFGALVFAGSRGVCESDARWISRVMPEPHELSPSLVEKRMDLLGDLRSLSTGVDPVLEETVLHGVAFHREAAADCTVSHSCRLRRLTTWVQIEERYLIAAAYDAGTILVCVATCSLAAGINLPARRVILHGARMGRELIGPSMLRQMRGRVGRQGKSPVGETYLCCRDTELEQILELMHAEIPPVSSCLNNENRRVQRALLEAISIRLATSRESVQDYFSRSLLSRSHGRDFVRQCIETGLQEVQDMGLATSEVAGSFAPTQLGRAIVASAIDPDDGVFVHKELSRALRAFVMDGDMHILYAFTPVQDFAVGVDWQAFRNEMESLDESGLRVLSFVGIKPTAILRLAQGGLLKENTPEERELARVHRRFYLAFQLRDLCNEVPIHVVSRKYRMPRGTVQNLSQTCQGFAAGMVKFCQTMGWGALAAALDHFSDRLMAGARTDLLALTKIPFIKSRTARVFWEGGYRSIASIANADPKELLPVLMQAQPNKVRLKGRDDEKLEEKLLAKATVISTAANRLWQLQMQADIDEE